LQADIRYAIDEMSGLQKASSQSLVHIQFPEGAIDFRREKGRIYGVETRQQRGIRAAIIVGTFCGCGCLRLLTSQAQLRAAR
jgi:hypothetical protein